MDSTRFSLLNTMVGFKGETVSVVIYIIDKYKKNSF